MRSGRQEDVMPARNRCAPAGKTPGPHRKAGAGVWAWPHGGAYLVQTDLEFLIAFKLFTIQICLKFIYLQKKTIKKWKWKLKTIYFLKNILLNADCNVHWATWKCQPGRFFFWGGKHEQKHLTLSGHISGSRTRIELIFAPDWSWRSQLSI